MSASKEFKAFFDYKFSRDWILRNILVNQLVFLYKNPKLDEENILVLKKYLASHSGGGDLAHFEGISQELVLEEIFSGGVTEEIGLLHPANSDYIIKKTVNHYGLKNIIDGKKTAKEFLWDVYHESRKDGSSHMLGVVKKLMEGATGLKSKEVILPIGSQSTMNYLEIPLSQKSNKLLITFETGIYTRQKGVVAESRPYKISNDVTTYNKSATPLLCALDFSQTIIENAKSANIFLVQLLSLLRFSTHIKKMKQSGVSQDNIQKALSDLFIDAEFPLSVDATLDRIESTLAK